MSVGCGVVCFAEVCHALRVPLQTIDGFVRGGSIVPSTELEAENQELKALVSQLELELQACGRPWAAAAVVTEAGAVGWAGKGGGTGAGHGHLQSRVGKGGRGRG